MAFYGPCVPGSSSSLFSPFPPSGAAILDRRVLRLPFSFVERKPLFFPPPPLFFLLSSFSFSFTDFAAVSQCFLGVMQNECDFRQNDSGEPDLPSPKPSMQPHPPFFTSPRLFLESIRLYSSLCCAFFFPRVVARLGSLYTSPSSLNSKCYRVVGEYGLRWASSPLSFTWSGKPGRDACFSPARLLPSFSIWY